MAYGILNFSDIHLNHPRVPTETTINSMLRILEDNKKLLKSTDIITISGDLFDGLVTMASSSYPLIISFITQLALICVENGIKLRILEGTQSHDFGQASAFGKIFKNLEIDLDYLYVDDIHVEYMSDLNMHVLYVPDEMGHNDIVLDKVRKLYATLNITKVDVAIMHGNFKYQINVDIDGAFDERAWLDLVKGYIIIGHVHTHSRFDRILCPGSVDRLTFGQEENKGVLYISSDNYMGEDRLRYIFIENKQAVRFDTIRSENPALIIKKMKTMPKDSNLRVITTVGKEMFISNIPKRLRVVFDKPKEADKDKVIKPIDMSLIKVPNIEKTNVLGLLLEAHPFENEKILVEELDSLIAGI